MLMYGVGVQSSRMRILHGGIAQWRLIDGLVCLCMGWEYNLAVGV